MKQLKIAYIGGGSKAWARSFMQDLALAEDLEGQVALYDIDLPAAERNRKIAQRLHKLPQAVSRFEYTVCERLEDALTGADVVLISILPATFTQMRSDVHTPERYGVYQSVGDTVGPGGMLRAMRTLPLYEGFAQAIRDCCPRAWVLNLTNPMSACVKALYDAFPDIKAFGCCHEIFHTQDFLCCVLREMTGVEATRRDIYTDASGVNHFTWITEARYQDYDLLELLPAFMDRYFEPGYYEHGPADLWKTDPFAYGNRVKMDLFRRYGALAAAGDRHLVEFCPGRWYLDSPEMVRKWHFALTSVDFREQRQAELVAESEALAAGEAPVTLAPSGEELVRLIRGLMGLEQVVSNVNLPNAGQMPGLPLGSIVETNCVFSNGLVKPVVSRPLPDGALALVARNCANIDLTCEAIRARDLKGLLCAFQNQPLCDRLTLDEARDLFREMCDNTRAYLAPDYHW